jgi:hypothetical protein
MPPLLLPAGAAVAVAAVLLRLLRVVPVAAVRRFADRRAGRLPLAGRFGEVRALVEDRLAAADVRATVAGTIRDCRAEGCGTVVLVGHGAGTVAGYMTLADEAYGDLTIETFITHGQALGTAWRLGHADEYDVADRHPQRLYRGDRLRGNLTRATFRSGLRWHDFRASHDPAAAGGLASGPRVTLPELVGGSSTLVLNRMSLAADHDRYWDNDEEFVLPVARLIDTSPDGTTRRSRFFPEGRSTNRVARRRHRVRLLQVARLVLAASAVAGVVVAAVDPFVPGSRSSLEVAGQAAWDGLAAVVDAIRPALASADVSVEVGGVTRTAAAVIGALLVALAYWLAWRVMTGLWDRWDARERRIALQPIPAWRPLAPLAVQLGLVAGGAAWLATVPATGDWTFAAPSGVAVLVALALAALTGRGTIRRPPQEELVFEGVDP